MRSILVSAEETIGLEQRLQTALDLARVHSGHLTLLFDIPLSRYVTVDAQGINCFASEALDAARQDEDAAVARIEARLAREDVPFDIVRSETDPAAALASAAQLCDLLIVSRACGIAGELALLGHAPVLALPDGKGLSVPVRRGCIAWDGSEQAAAAVRAATPLLRLCETVEVLEVGAGAADFPATDVLRYLSRHDIGADLIELEREGSVAQSLLTAVRHMEADLLVMGAYGHSRLREFLFGGVTAHFLAAPDAPALLLAH